MRLLWVGIFCITMFACSSDYSSSDKMLACKKDINTAHARQILQQIVWGDKVSRGELLRQQQMNFSEVP